MTYNLTNLGLTNQSYVHIVQIANDASSGILIGGAVIAIFIIQIALLSRRVDNIGECITFSGWLCFLYSVFLAMSGLLNFYFPLSFLAVAGLGTYWMYYRGSA